jgi:hypothetical protein
MGQNMSARQGKISRSSRRKKSAAPELRFLQLY